ncbi:Beta-barrel assembly machine subunit BamC [Lampropedia hyalina DSM 16112]|jgi:outer membrane protein assembly factor BamC|uniref:Beta-barrel assembly machine subunit BamC n=1 Tax=Lampropedia hyalina DSM 16112 TaxID=1122156 RepID=A0A1M4V9B6_9BURK|nr:outer membrane protein assembly factor BamC [Lampropedia hyalina]SHE65559.1 Beta-barrel assembly machine subunit BamC [Lampropedia hyalina DSM 16112]
MNVKSQPLAFKTTLLATAVVLSGCSVFQEDKIDYKSASRGVSLEVPPDLTQLMPDARYNVPGGVVSANAMLGVQAQRGAASNVAASSVADVQIQRENGVRWLSVPRGPDVLWDPVRQFWLDNGFVLAMDQPELGIMETDWAENRAKLPQDVIRATLGRVLDSLYSTGERDKFRTRLERRSDGGTDIFITHRGMSEEFSSPSKENTIWQPRPNDPELEAEFLRRLMVTLGISEEQSRAILQADVTAATAAAATQTSPQSQVRVVQAGGVPALLLPEDNFDRAWRRVGTALDRTGFTVEDRNLSQGLYYVRYVAKADQDKKPGFFGRLLGRSGQTSELVKYRILVTSQAEGAVVRILTEAGEPAPAEQASAIVKLLQEDMQ